MSGSSRCSKASAHVAHFPVMPIFCPLPPPSDDDVYDINGDIDGDDDDDDDDAAVLRDD